jgi:hypothetical protein
MALPGEGLKTSHLKYLCGVTQHCVLDKMLSASNGLGVSGLEYEVGHSNFLLNTGKYVPT